MADSTHAQSWIEMFRESEVNSRTFANVVFEHGVHKAYNPTKWENETYVLVKPEQDRGAKLNYIFSSHKFIKPIVSRLEWYLNFNQKFLRRVIRRWKPDIVHSLSLNPSSIFAWQALKEIEKEKRPLFVVSSWGSDIYKAKDIAADREKLVEILANCDGFISDCKRDIKNALSLNLLKEKVAFNCGVPVTGGIDPRKLSGFPATEKRNVILVPKAFEGVANKVFSVIEALNMTKDLLQDFEVHLLMCDSDTKWYLSKMSSDLRNICFCYGHIPKEEVVSLMRRSRVMIAPSVSDGTPVSLLEAMSFGVLPIVSPLDSIKEWVVDNENGLLVNAVNPNQIAEALKIAITNNDLFYNAQKINQRIIREKANRQDIRIEVVNYYQRIIKKRTTTEFEQ